MVTISRSGGYILFTTDDARVHAVDVYNFNWSELETGIFRFQTNEGSILTPFLEGPHGIADFEIFPTTGATLADYRADLLALKPDVGTGGPLVTRVEDLEDFQASQAPVVHNQAVAAPAWAIPHTFASGRPNVVVTSAATNASVGFVADYSTPTLVILLFSPPLAGKAVLTT